MKERDVVTWNSLMLGYAENGEAEAALALFAGMENRSCQLSGRSFVSALKACINMASKEDAVRVSGGRELKVRSLENGMGIHSRAAKASLGSDFFIANMLVDFYVKCGSSVDARRVFDRMSQHDVVSWTSLLLGYAENGEGNVALDLFVCMQRAGCVPNALTFVAALKACICVVALEYVKAIHADIYRFGFEVDVVLANCVVDAYGKCGSVSDAKVFFDGLGKIDPITWTSMISAYSSQGDAENAFLLFRRMRDEGYQANSITFVSVLTACSYAGLVKQGKECFEIMVSGYGLNPALQHYTCLVDLFARTNELDAAMKTLQSMPSKADAVTWRIVLSSCRKWKNVEIGKVAFEALVKLDEGDVAAYMLMGSIYGSQEMWEEQRRVETMRMKARAWKKFEPARSWWIHSFMVGDKNHTQIEEIQAKLGSLLQAMKDQGYVPDIASLNNTTNSGICRHEKEEALCGHSERLAIACALINTAPGATIRVTKNLRVCDDCHGAIAIISKIEQRSIVCRDASRFHVYKDGSCSCKDHW